MLHTIGILEDGVMHCDAERRRLTPRVRRIITEIHLTHDHNFLQVV